MITWHKAKDIPKPNEFIITEYMNENHESSYIIEMFNPTVMNWIDYVNNSGFYRWCYLIDSIQNKNKV